MGRAWLKSVPGYFGVPFRPCELNGWRIKILFEMQQMTGMLTEHYKNQVLWITCSGQNRKCTWQEDMQCDGRSICHQRPNPNRSLDKIFPNHTSCHSPSFHNFIAQCQGLCETLQYCRGKIDHDGITRVRFQEGREDRALRREIEVSQAWPYRNCEEWDAQVLASLGKEGPQLSL